MAAAAAVSILTFGAAALAGVGIVASGKPALAHTGKFRHADPKYLPAGPPGASVSRYMTTTRPKPLFSMGCVDGRKIYLGAMPPDSLIILAFGMPVHRAHRYGASVFEGFASTHKIRRGVLAYARGWMACVGDRTPAHLELAIGTSNYGSDVTFRHGRAWAHMVNRANALLHADGRGIRIRITGANDIETGWAGPTASKAWVRGYASEARFPYYNFGAAGGCPPYGTCNGGWTVEDVWFVAWGRGKALMVPEIYANTGANAEQWYRISRYGMRYHGKELRFAGVMTQLRSCLQVADPCIGISNTPEAGWQQLWHALNADRRTAQGIRFLTDIAWTE